MGYFKQYYKGVSIENKDGFYIVNGMHSTAMTLEQIKDRIDVYEEAELYKGKQLTRLPECVAGSCTIKEFIKKNNT